MSSKNKGRVLATIWGKVFDQNDANPNKKGNYLARRCESDGHGFESQRQQRFFLQNLYIECTYYRLGDEFVHQIGASCIM